MNKIIVPTGYMGSGSSAVTDYVKEFENCNCPNGTYEYVFLHCPNGLFDLEDQLLIGNNAIKSDYSIRSFYRQMKILYDKKYYWVGNYKKIVGPNFLKITQNFLDEIVQYKYKGFWYVDEELNNNMFWKLLLQKPIKIVSMNKIKFKKVLNTDGKMYISYIGPQKFYKCAKKYIYEVIDMINTNNKNIILDQFLLPFNLHRIDNYFDDNLRVVVVERDPRDLFVLNKYIWHEKHLEVPIPEDAKTFCDFYRNMRMSEKKAGSSKIYRIYLEDLIYYYDKTSKAINGFIGLKEKEHKKKYYYFNPNLSIKNTQLFRNKKYFVEINIIEKELKDYLYDFPYELNNDVQSSIEDED
jgi:hypothetical protein